MKTTTHLVLMISSFFYFTGNAYADSSNLNGSEEILQEMLDSESDLAKDRRYKKRRRRNRISRKRRTRKNPLLGINVFAFYNSVDQIGTTTNSNYNTYSTTASSNNRTLGQSTGKYQSTVSYGLGVEYSKKKLFRAGPVRFGASLGTLYEHEREIRRQYVDPNGYIVNASGGYRYVGNNLVNASSVITDPKVSIILPYVNANISYKKTYAFGGINYSFPNVTNAPNEEFSGLMGYQVGFGANINRRVAVEMAQRWLYFGAENKINPNQYYNGSGVNGQGLGINQGETLNISGLALKLKVLF